MLGKKIAFIPILFLIFSLVTGCAPKNKGIVIIDAKIVSAVDEQMMPVKITDSFSKGTSKVSCWFQWRDAKVNTEIMAKWHYVTDNVHVFDHPFTISKKEGLGNVILRMPQGKTLPSGLYRIDLYLGDRLLKSLNFRVD